jgi:hypothetical protein
MILAAIGDLTGCFRNPFEKDPSLHIPSRDPVRSLPLGKGVLFLDGS